MGPLKLTENGAYMLRMAVIAACLVFGVLAIGSLPKILKLIDLSMVGQ